MSNWYLDKLWERYFGDIRWCNLKLLRSHHLSTPAQQYCMLHTRNTHVRWTTINNRPKHDFGDLVTTSDNYCLQCNTPLYTLWNSLVAQSFSL
jgi:hypothetical protein